jgi:hypothetical protein
MNVQCVVRWPSLLCSSLVKTRFYTHFTPSKPQDLLPMNDTTCSCHCSNCPSDNCLRSPQEMKGNCWSMPFRVMTIAHPQQAYPFFVMRKMISPARWRSEADDCVVCLIMGDLACNGSTYPYSGIRCSERDGSMVHFEGKVF